jgi:predicted DsbA family dithiol-disulfide isomerase
MPEGEINEEEIEAKKRVSSKMTARRFTAGRFLDSEESAAKVRKDLDEGQKAGVKVTPTFLLGLTEPNNPKITVQKTIV